MWKLCSWLLFVSCIGLASGCSKPEALDSSPVSDSGTISQSYRIAVIPKGTTHVFWKSVEEGAMNAAEELGLDVVWKGPLKENDRAQQIAIVEQFVSEKVAGIVLAPLDENALLRPVRAAMNNGIPVVIIDSALNGEAGSDFVSFISTDNEQGGYLGGQRLGELLGGEGKVVLLRYQVGSASTDNRETGFLRAMSEHPGIRVMVDNQYAGPTRGEAIQKSEELLDLLREADGIFCPNESSTAGMLVTLRKHQLVGKVKFVGFDSSPELVVGLEDGELDALVVQNPRRMGYEGVRAIHSGFLGGGPAKRIDTGVQVVSRANMNDPEISVLIAN